MIAPKKLLYLLLRKRQKKILLTLTEIREPEPLDRDKYKLAEG